MDGGVGGLGRPGCEGRGRGAYLVFLAFGGAG